MIDIHCHILPGIDDGPSDISESLEMASIAVRNGITTLIATPHVPYLSDVVCSPARIREGVATLNRALKEKGIPLTVLPGADVNILLPPAAMADYTLNGTGYLLIEFPHTHLPMNAKEVLFNIVLKGLRPIITHPERNGSVIRNPEQIMDLINTTALVQITAGSLSGDFGPDVKACADYLLRRGVVSFIATDGHAPDWRPPLLSEGLRAAAEIIGMDRAREMVTKNPEAVLAGRPLDVPSQL
ncbi:MAG: CpsB/CapC family capsule biosynthesis tyrosine phosphatase [Nitrospirota bacterium]